MKLNGLANLGNTCFLNSCIQIMLRIEDLNKFLDEKKYRMMLKNIPDSQILLEWDSLRELLQENENCVIAPNGFLKAVQKVAMHKNIDIFTGYAQNDMPEFLIFFVNCMHTAISRDVNMKITGREVNAIDKLAKIGYTTMKNIYETDYSEMIDLFFSLSVTTIFDTNEENKDFLSIKFDPIFMVSLPVRKERDISLYDCFNEYCKLERMENDNQWFNDKTNKKQDALKQCSFWSLPKYLIIDLKRFDNQLRKIDKHIHIPIEGLDLSRYVCGYNSCAYVYDLMGVVNHMGNVLSGHYIANIVDEKKEWWEMNDSSVRQLKIEEVINKNTYCLFYKKREKMVE